MKQRTTKAKHYLKNFLQNFLTWCAGQQWDYLLVLQKPKGATADEVDEYFQQLVAEIETYDGSLDFHWVRFDPLAKNGGATEFYVLVSGVSSGEWWCWGRRWRDINGDRDAVGGFGYSRRWKWSRLRPALTELLADTKFTVQMGIGPKRIRRRRELKVYQGWPIEPLPPIVREKQIKLFRL